jgi:ribose transport system substrate-binding protein
MTRTSITRRTLVLAVTAGLALAALIAVSRASEAAARASLPVATTVLIGESSPVASNPNQQAITYGQREAAKKLGWRFRSLDANLSPDKQVSDIDTLINLGAKGIVTWTLDAGAAGAVHKRALDRGIPVVDFGSTQNVTTAVFDERAWGCSQGDKAAAYIQKRIRGARLLVIGGPPVPSIVNYTNCFIKAAKRRGLKVLARRDNVKDTAQTAQPLVENMLTKYPDAQAIWGYNDPSALGAGAVVRAAGKRVWVEGKQKGIIIMGANGSKEAADGVKAGVMTLTWDAQPSEMGRIAVKVLSMHLKQGLAIGRLPKVIVVPMIPWDAKNVARYVAPMKRTVGLGAVPPSWIKRR